MSIEAMKQAVENMEWSTPQGREAYWGLVKAIAEAEKQEPVGRFAKFTDGIWREVAEGSAGVPLYTTPQQRKPLTDEQIKKSSLEVGMQEHYMDFHSGFIRFARAIETAHGIKG